MSRLLAKARQSSKRKHTVQREDRVFTRSSRVKLLAEDYWARKNIAPAVEGTVYGEVAPVTAVQDAEAPKVGLEYSVPVNVITGEAPDFEMLTVGATDTITSPKLRNCATKSRS